MMRAYFRDASFESSSDFAPVTTILPEAKIKAVVLGSRIRMMTAAKRFGLYSAFLACRAIVLRSKRQSRLTVATMFLYMQDKPHVSKLRRMGYTYCKVGTIPLTPCVAPGVAAGVAGVTPLPFWP